MNKVYSFIGLCKKAGKLVAGEANVEAAIKKQSAKLVILAKDSSYNTKKKFNNSAKFYNVDIIEFGTKEELAYSIGESLRATIAVTDEGFSSKIKELIGVEG